MNPVDYWDSQASEYGVWAEPDYQAGIEACMAQLLPVLKGRILDIGCGIGRLTIPVANAFPDFEVVGVDISNRMLVRALERAPGNASFYLTDGRTLPDVATFDAVYSIVTFQHMLPEQTRSYIHQVARILNPEGKFRFQFVEGEERSGFSQMLDARDVRDWCREAGLSSSVERGIIFDSWVWVTATR